MKKMILICLFGLFTLNSYAASVPFQGTGNFSFENNVISDTTFNNGFSFNNPSDSSFLGFGGFDSFELAVGESLHFWYNDSSNVVNNLFGVISGFVTQDINAFNQTFSFFGLASATGEIIEVSGSRTINAQGLVTSNSMNVSGVQNTVPEPTSLALLAIGLIAVGYSKKGTAINRQSLAS